MPKKTEEKAVKISQELHRELKTLSGSSGIPIYTLVEEAWKPYRKRLMEAAAEVRGIVFKNSEDLPENFQIFDALLPKPAFSDLSEEERRWLQDLLEVLRSGNADAVSAVTENIKVFRQFVKLASGQDHSVPRGGKSAQK